MADLTLQQRFGSSVTFNATSKTLTIALNDLTDAGDIVDSLGLDISALSSANINSYASKILYGLILLNFQKQAATNNDDSVGLYIQNSGRRDATRNGIAQFAYNFNLAFYTANNLAAVLDPDLVV